MTNPRIEDIIWEVGMPQYVRWKMQGARYYHQQKVKDMTRAEYINNYIRQQYLARQKEKMK